jgi:LysR family nitrogen assimilation transcriptional regulator
MNALLTLPLLKRLSAEAPQIRLRPVEELSVVLTEWVANGRLDLAISFPISSMEGLVWEPLVGETTYFIERAIPGQPSGGTITFAEAASHELVLTVTSQRYRAFLQGIAEPHGIDIKIVQQMQSVSTLRDLLIQGDASTIVPLGVVAREVAAGTLRARRIVDPEIHREVLLMRSDSRPASKAEQVVAAIIRELVVETMVHSPGFWVPIRPGVKLSMSATDRMPLRDSRQAVNEDERFAERADTPAVSRSGKSDYAAAFDDLLRG